MILSRLQNYLKKFSRPLLPLNHIEVSRSAVLHNFGSFQKLHPHSNIWPVVKSNAYGHGLPQIVQILKSRQFKYYIADSYLEALKIWSLDPRPVLLIGSIHPDNYPKMDFSRLTLTLQDLQTLHVLVSLKRPIKVHLKINTGLNRQGVDPGDIPGIITLLKKNHQIELEGVYSHLADADNPNDTCTPKQLHLFKTCLSQIQTSGFRPQYVHLAATYGSTKINDPIINVIRLGLGLYGLGPLSGLRPALSFYSSITKIGSLHPGDGISYNLTYRSKTAGSYAVIPVGYFEGLDRRLSNIGHVKYQNTFLPIRGRICMNLTIVDLQNTHPALFDDIEIISPISQDKNSIENIARLCCTIPYDILVHLHESIQRRLVP